MTLSENPFQLVPETVIGSTDNKVRIPSLTIDSLPFPASPEEFKLFGCQTINWIKI